MRQIIGALPVVLAGGVHLCVDGAMLGAEHLQETLRAVRPAEDEYCEPIWLKSRMA